MKKLFLAVALTLSANSIVMAQDAQTTESQTQSQTQPLQGGVQIIELSLERLREIGVDIKHMLKAASSLYDEVTIQPVTIITEPEVVGFGTVINIPIGTMPTGPVQPPKKERLDLAMNHLNPIIKLMKSDVDDFMSGKRKLDLNDETRQELQPIFKAWVDDVNALNGELNNLQSLTNSPPFDNSAIAQATQSLQESAKKLEQARRVIYKKLQKEAKQEKKNKS
jgi:hypothetical protein